MKFSYICCIVLLCAVYVVCIIAMYAFKNSSVYESFEVFDANIVPSGENLFLVFTDVNGKKSKYLYDNIELLYNDWEIFFDKYTNISPFKKYFKYLHDKYIKSMGSKYSYDTITPIYKNMENGMETDLRGGSEEVKSLNVRSIYSPKSINIRSLVRNEQNTSQLHNSYFAIPNNKNLDENELIDMSVTSKNRRIPATYTDDTINEMVNTTINEDYQKNVEYNKHILNLTRDIEKLNTEIMNLNRQLINNETTITVLKNMLGKSKEDSKNFDQLYTKLVKDNKVLSLKLEEYINLYKSVNSSRISDNIDYINNS